MSRLLARWLLAAALLFTVAMPGHAAIVLVTHGTANSTTGDGFTSGTFDTTGSNFIVFGFSSAASGGTLTDSKSNTWLPLTQAIDSFSDRWIQLVYCENCTVGTGHTFTISGTGNHPALAFEAFSGVATSSSFDVQNNNANGFSSSTTTGSITPGAANEVVVTALAYDDSVAATINSGLIVTDANPQTGFGWTGIAMAHIIQTTATAENPTWSWVSGARNVASIAAFKPGGGGPTVVYRKTMIGIGR